jgi:hypothetical protein
MVDLVMHLGNFSASKEEVQVPFDLLRRIRYEFLAA